MAKNRKMPKKISGVKIPKVLRKSSLLRSVLASPTGRQVLADALVAAAGAAAAALVAKSDAAAKAGEAVADTAEEGSKLLKNALRGAAGALTEAIGSAAKTALVGEPASSAPARRERGKALPRADRAH